MKTITLILSVLLLSIQCKTAKQSPSNTVQVDSIQENDIYVNFSHDSLFLSYYFSDQEAVDYSIMDSIVIEVPRFSKSMKVITDHSPIHSRLFLGKSRINAWTETPVTVFFYKDGFRIDRYNLKL